METKICTKCEEEKELCFFGKTKQGHRSHCNDCRKIESKEYREKYPEKRKETSRKYIEKNKEKIKIKQEEYKKNNYEKLKLTKLKSYHKNKNKPEQIERRKLYYLKNKPRRSESERNRKKNNILYKISAISRNRINGFLIKKNVTKKNKTFDIVGCTPEFLKEHLEKQFTEGMSWNNYGKDGWHVDHKTPLCSAKTEEEIYKLCHYTNLQPLWWYDNLKKGGKLV